MICITGEIAIDRPVEQVFDVVADPRNEPCYNPRILRSEQLSDGPIGAGTRFRDETRSLGRTVALLIEITDYQRPHSLALVIQLPGTEIHGTLAFDPIPSGTRLRWDWEVEPHGVLKLLAPVIARLGRRQEEQTWSSLKRWLETGAPHAVPAGVTA